MRNSLTLLVFGLVLSFISCQKEETSTPSSLPNKVAGAKEPVEPDQTDPYTNTVVYNPPTTPTTTGAEPFILSGKASADFTSSGKFDKFTTDFVNFKNEPTASNFSFVPPTGSTKVWMGFIVRANGGDYYIVKAYPVAISNGNAYYSSAPVNSPIGAGNLFSGSIKGDPTGTPENFQWIPAQYGPDGKVTAPGYWSCTKCEGASITGEVTVSLLKMNADGTLTLKATVKIGGTTYTIDRVNKRLVP
jgi:hypothetical protein